MHTPLAVQGGIDEGEDALVTAVRELQEETSISSVEVSQQHPFVHGMRLLLLYAGHTFLRMED